MQKITEILNSLSGRRLAIERETTETARRILAPELQGLLKRCESLKAFGWTQFTPERNHGEPCYFTVGNFKVSCVDDHDDSLEDGWDDVWVPVAPKGWRLGEELWLDLYELGASLRGARSEMLAAFGDDVIVIIEPTTVKIRPFKFSGV
jgi:hypothetical protein